MRFLPNIRYGTERYPERVARPTPSRQHRAIAAVTLAVFAVTRFLQGLQSWRNSSRALSLAFALSPMLHRIGALAVPLALTAIACDVQILILASSWRRSTGQPSYI